MEKLIERLRKHKLCYVSDGVAYFTTRDVKDQWGDDWDDRPYEHNAGLPYSWRESMECPPYSLIELPYSSFLETPEFRAMGNSNLSVKEINDKITPWLMEYGNSQRDIRIFAGTSALEFICVLIESGGEIYLPLKLIEKGFPDFFAELVSSSKEIADSYLRSQGIDVDELQKRGERHLEKLRREIAQKLKKP